MNYSSLIFSILAAGLLYGCFTNTPLKSPENLDIDMKRSAVKLEQPDANRTNKPIVLEHYETIDWKSFFKPAPNSVERNLLEQKLNSSPQADTSEELLTLGRQQLVLGRYAAAKASFMRAHRIDSERTDVLLEIAKLYLRTYRVEDAFQVLGQVKNTIESGGSDNRKTVFLYKYILALTYLGANDVKSGRKIISDLLGVDKTFTPGYASLAYSYLKDDKIQIAEFIAKQGLDRCGESASLYNLRGVVYQRQGDHTKAQKYFDSALKVVPTYAPALVNRANSMLAVGQLDTAEINLQKAINASPGDVNAYIALALCRKKMGRYEDAMSDLNRAIDLDPDNSTARFHLAVLLMTKYNKPQVALRLFHEVGQVRGKNDRINEMARVYIDDINSKSGISIND